MPPIIEVKNISKQYVKKSPFEASYGSLRDTIAEKLSFNKAPKKREENTFWALKDVSFTVEEGEVVGIIGRNGAGKSTLLKILAQITTPTDGEAILRGRVGSLLEVGTGFHPELTGKENIYMNGAILGMTQREIRAKYDEIVDFAGVEDFINMPVKRYSSGMRMRLAFAVAAHLEPEIMIVDEVLAVGDAEFQKKCLGKMKDIAGQGRTVLFVSHNMNAVRSLCSRGIFLVDGNVDCDSSNMQLVLEKYMNFDNHDAHLWQNENNSSYDEIFKPLKFYVSDIHSKIVENHIQADDEIFVNIEFEMRKEKTNLAIGYVLYDGEGNTLYWSYQLDHKKSDCHVVKEGHHHIASKIPPNILKSGQYTVQMIAGYISEGAILSPESSNLIIGFNITPSACSTTFTLRRSYGIVSPVIKWIDKNN